MGKIKLRGKDLRAINYSSNKAISMALAIMSKHYKYTPKEEQLQLLNDIKNNHEKYLQDDILGALAENFKKTEVIKKVQPIDLLSESEPFNVYGRKNITSNAYQQMRVAMKLPIAKQGALMPDAHLGYGLPIGGVLASENSVIPYGVGVDIGCRMSLSIYDIRPEYLKRYNYQLKTALKQKTSFGTGGSLNFTQEHEILDRPDFSQTPLLKQLHGKAVEQLGSSGSGNHFVEFGVVTLEEGNDLGVEAGEYVGLLAHSGSRGFGANIAKHYTEVAMKQCPLPKGSKHLAWLDLDSEAGQEYWLSMNLAGDYAKACHDQIHYNLSKHLGIKAIGKIENHHNFAWKHQDENGNPLVIHRKGATPANKGELGIIPGSMTANGYLVRGKGNKDALWSASHGAGRQMSRSAVKESFTGSALKKMLSQYGVTLVGGSIDEAPVAYKDIKEVMRYQTDLVDIIGKFTPKIVRMDKN